VHHSYGDYEVCTSLNTLLSGTTFYINVIRKFPDCIDSLLKKWKVTLLRRDSGIIFK
jgi:hypothetical protein